MSDKRISEEYKRYEQSSVMKRIAYETHQQHYCGQTSSATFVEVCEIMSCPSGQRDTRVLDAGCGNGCFSLEIAKKFNVLVDGIDLSSEVIEVAKNNSYKQGLDHVCQFFVGNFCEMDGESKYSSILSVGSLYWNPGLDRTLNVWNRLLTRNGRLIVFTNLEVGIINDEDLNCLGQTKFIKQADMNNAALMAGFVKEYEHDGTNVYCSWLDRWCESTKRHFKEVVQEMGEIKAIQLEERFKTYLKLAAARKVLRVITVYRKVS